MLRKIQQFAVILIVFTLFSSLMADSPRLLQPDELLSLRTIGQAALSPDGKWVAYVLYVPRAAQDDAGSSWSELHLVSSDGKTHIPYITGEVNVRGLEWNPKGGSIGFLMRRDGDSATQVYVISQHGGEARKVTDAETSISEFHWHPDGKQLAYLAVSPESGLDKKLKKMGYGFIFYEENLRHRNLYLQESSDPDNITRARQVTSDVTVWDFTFHPEGKSVAASVSPKNLIDHKYAFRKVKEVNLENGTMTLIADNPGKLGNYSWSPNGKKLVYSAALTKHDHAVSQVLVVNRDGSKTKNLTPEKFAGHVVWAGWNGNDEIYYLSGEGVWSTLSKVAVGGGKRTVIYNSKDSGLQFSSPEYNAGWSQVVFLGESSQSPANIYSWKPGGKTKALTDVNPWLKDVNLSKQDVFEYKARDGQAVEGLLIYPAGYKTGEKHPLVVTVHGGPESHYLNRWVSGYSTPGQVLAAKGYFVFYPNYRSSTGYGLEFAAAGYGDPAGVEFDDIADGIDALIASGMIDGNRVGLGGGSYGGFASGWFATYYTKYVRAVCMFVGISDIISKRGTTDITNEELLVHSGKMLEEMWDLNLKRSPIYWAHQSKTATLIYGGAADTRVSPTQSMELYYRMKMNNHPAVRLVQYPGEGHGNRKQPGRIDVLYRQLDWYDWYVRDLKPLDGPMPPLDISDKYGLDLN